METEISGRLLITGDLHGDTAALTMITRANPVNVIIMIKR